MKLRKWLGISLLTSTIVVPQISLAQEFTGAQYAKALWMATRFFGAQRSGQGPNWIIQDTQYPTSFVKDSYNGKDISGGWFDCGDHVMFGQNQFYAPYVMARAFITYPKAWYDKYDGTNYADYKAKLATAKTTADSLAAYGENGGSPNGIADILEELRYEADFVVKISPDASTFIVQKGLASLDHRNWVHPGKMSTLKRSEGGESDGSRATMLSTGNAYSPGMAAAFLAIMARVEPDAVRAAAYLQHAKYAFEYSKTQTGIASESEGSFYQSLFWGDGDGRRWREGRVLAAYELYLTTNIPDYWTYVTTEYPLMADGIYSRFEYANAVPLARLLLEPKGLNATKQWVNFAEFLKKIQTVDGNGITDGAIRGNNFYTRAPIGAAYIQGMHSFINNDASKDAMIFKQIDYVLGANVNGQPYMSGWDEVAKRVETPHHRGYWGNENTAVSDASYDSKSAPAKNFYLGGVIGGALDGSYIHSVTNWGFNEVCSDMNATWVGALAYAVQKLAPTDQVGIQSRPALQVPVFHIRQHGNTVTFLNSKQKSFFVKITDARGKNLGFIKGESSVQWTAQSRGVYFAKITDLRGNELNRSLVIAQ